MQQGPIAQEGARTYTAAVRPAKSASPARRPASIAAISAISAISALATACGAAPGVVGGVYRDDEARYRIGPRGSDWQALSVEGQNDLAYHDERAGAIVQVNATCDPDSDVPLTALTNHLLIGFTERHIEAQTVIDMDEREALRTHVRASLDGVAREILFYVLKKDDCVYDFALIAPPGAQFESALAEFEPFVAGFSTEAP